MSLSKEEWIKAKEAWGNIKKQALIDLEQSELYISKIEEKLKEFTEPKSI